MDNIERFDVPEWREINIDDFNNMRTMLNEIEMKILGVNPFIQLQFYKPIKHMIFEAWQDACNSSDNFLFPKE